MARKTVSIKADHLQRVASIAPHLAIAELVWNGLDADASVIHVALHEGDLGKIDKITIKDNGTGISLDRADDSFSTIGGSWKNRERATPLGRCLHGQKGEGRFKAFSLGRSVLWDSTYLDAQQQTKHIHISALRDSLNEVDINEDEKGKLDSCGTLVTINEIDDKVQVLTTENLISKLTYIFAGYLCQYSNVQIFVNGTLLDPRELINSESEIILGEDSDIHGKMKIILWDKKDVSDFYLCKENYSFICDYDTKNKIRKQGHNYTVYLCGEIINNLNESDNLSIVDMDKNAGILITEAIAKLNEYLRIQKEKENSQRITNWIDLEIYPYTASQYTPIEEIEKNLFDMVAVKVEDNLPRFRSSSIESKRLTFQLLSNAIKENPASMQRILEEVLKLNDSEKEMFSKLLENTSLTSIIRSSKIVADRLNFLKGLENLLFDKENKKALLERDQLHKILENETWVFMEDFNFSGSENTLNDVLKIHATHLDYYDEESFDTEKPVFLSDGKKGRVDLFFHKARKPSQGYKEYLVVELKRPSQKINSEVITQIKNYAYAVSSDERFDHSKTKWTFIAVSNELDQFAKREANQRGKRKGVVSDDAEYNVEVIVMTWAEVINNARARLDFYKEQLSYNVDHNSVDEYLREKHNEYLPKTYS
ncbi:ATP-binding protein [Rodentibacter pneumotropicus]|uniref:ATP-binding protein n=1 Tax=Rodentibacter pneumotropicus TaxID=758 RepID=UPI00109D5F0E|nr:ATP-binding protein [Rodentibacter pneumotropicus]THA08096.1 ATP-binding protein [Rodentibacter pneumotropicus]